MKIKQESGEHNTKNGSSVENISESDSKENDIKSETDHSGTINTSSQFVQPKIQKCDVCSKTYGSSSQLKRHKLIHTGENGFSCDLCDYKTKRKDSLKLHMRSHTGDTPYRCEKCGKQFKTKGSLRKHLVIHTGERRFQCDDCGQAFTRASILKIHKRVHTGERPYKCDECEESFRYTESLVKHKGKHKGVADFLCDICTKTFFNPIALRTHLKIHQNEGFKCSECGKTFKQKRNLMNHQIVDHQELPPPRKKQFSCENCEKRFPSNYLLKLHMWVHTGEKPHVCDICQKAFARSNALKVHKLIHSGEKPFKCSKCNRRFRELFPLKKHMVKIHEAEYKSPTPPLLKKQFEEKLPIPTPSSHPKQSSVKQSSASVEPSPMATIPCAKESIFSKVKGRKVDKENGNYHSTDFDEDNVFNTKIKLESNDS